MSEPYLRVRSGPSIELEAPREFKFTFDDVLDGPIATHIEQQLVERFGAMTEAPPGCKWVWLLKSLRTDDPPHEDRVLITVVASCRPIVVVHDGS